MVDTSCIYVVFARLHKDLENPLVGFCRTETECRQLVADGPYADLVKYIEWERFEVQPASTSNELFILVRGTPETLGSDFDEEFLDPEVLAVFSNKEEAQAHIGERVILPSGRDFSVQVLPFSVGWLREEFFSSGSSWPPVVK